MVLPIHDDNPTRRTPWVTYLFIVINVVVFFTEPIARISLSDETQLQQICRQEAFFRRYAAIPREITTGDQLPAVGRAVQPDSCQLIDPPPYEKSPALSVLYAMFLHGGWLHLGGNMLFLFVFGNNVEDRLGRLRYLLFYIGCGYLATYVFAWANARSTTSLVGASGAVAGVLGAYLVLFPRARVVSLITFLFFFPARLPAWLVLSSWFVIQYFYARGAGLTTGSNVAYLAHVAGFAAGFLAMLLLRPKPHRRPPAYALPPPGWS
jgi:membrane associated rhomboid family serine protease